MPTEPQPVTLADAVRRAVEVCDPEGGDDGLSELARMFEDADEPLAAVGDIEARVNEAIGRIEVDVIDPETDDAVIDAALAMARAVILYLAFRRDEIGEEPLELLRLAARAEYHGKPPAQVAAWLRNRGVAL